MFVFSGKDGRYLYALEAPHQHAGAGFGCGRSPPWEMSQRTAFLRLSLALPSRVWMSFTVRAKSFSTTGGMASPGDTNGDAIPEFVFGTPGQHLGDTAVVGRVFTFVSAR